MDEVGEINDYIQAQAGQTADIIMGIGRDETLGDKVSVTVIATGFHTGQKKAVEEKKPEMIVHHLMEEPVVFESEVEVPVETDVESVSAVNPLEPVLIVREELKNDPSPVVDELSDIPIESPPVDPMEPVLVIREEAIVASTLEEPFLIVRNDALNKPSGTIDYSGPFDEYPNDFEDIDDSPFTASIEQEPFVGFVSQMNMEHLTPEPDTIGVEDVFGVFTADEEVNVNAESDAGFELEQGLLTFEFPVAESEEANLSAEEVGITQSPVMEIRDDDEVVRHDLYSELPPSTPVSTPIQPVVGSNTPSQSMSPEDEMYIQSRERIMRLREISMRIQSPSGLADMEKEPAYRRRNVKLDEVTPSSESNVSRYTLSVEENRPEIRPNNSFLHDRVD